MEQRKKAKSNKTRVKNFNIDNCRVFEGYSESLLFVKNWELGKVFFPGKVVIILGRRTELKQNSIAFLCRVHIKKQLGILTGPK